MAQLLAKPDAELIEHLAQVTSLGLQIARQLGLPEKLRVKALLACAFHDIGKGTLDFQKYIRGERKKAYPHALASLPFILLAETQLAQHYGWDQLALEATAAVLTHHSPLGPELYKGYEAVTYHPELEQALRQVWELLQSHGVQGLPSVGEFWRTVQRLLPNSPAALLEESLPFDGTNKTLRGILQGLPLQAFAQVKTVLHLADWLASAKGLQPTVLFLQSGDSAIKAHLRTLDKPPRAFQLCAERTRDADVIWLRAPTGTGKTEALLLWAGNAERLLYLLPTQATTNAMWRRLQKIYGEEQVALAHGRASYLLRKESDDDPLDARLFGSVFAKPVTVATLDQYLLAHLHGRHWEERRTLARRATVVLDEIHAYEPYTLGLLLEALKREPPARLALASATLPESLLGLFPRGTLIEAELELWQRTRHRMQFREGSLLAQGPEQALHYARQGQRVLVIANTIRDAQTFYRIVQESGWPRLALLHARYILRDRATKEDEVSHAQPGTIFIATQVVEVSLDISYDVLITEIAPADALVQRMGRVNRLGKQPPAPVIIYTQWSEGTKYVYGEELLAWSLEIVRALPPTPTDRDLAEATRRLYERVVPSQEWQRELADGRATVADLQRILGCYTIDLSDDELRSRFTTRRGMVSIEVLPEQFIEEAYRLKEQNESWRLPELLVPVPIWWLGKFPEQFCAIADLRAYATYLPYDSELGLQFPSDCGESQVAIV
jgi:CRISPR-associated endonuclease/helicase Cas3